MEYKRLNLDIVQLDAVDSTNRIAADILKTNEPINGKSILAKNQFAGKGQLGNIWLSEANLNLTCSIILYPNLPADKVFYLNMISSLAVWSSLTRLTGAKHFIKWPNDILVEEKKTAGILIENQLRGNLIHSTIIGIGVNVNQTNFLPELRATSMRLNDGLDFDVNTVFEDIFFHLDFYFDHLMNQNYKLISDRYHQTLFGLDVIRNFSDTNGEFNGTIAGIDEQGKLKIHRENGIQKYDLKELKFIY